MITAYEQGKICQRYRFVPRGAEKIEVTYSNRILLIVPAIRIVSCWQHYSISSFNKGSEKRMQYLETACQKYNEIDENKVEIRGKK